MNPNESLHHARPSLFPCVSLPPTKGRERRQKSAAASDVSTLLVTQETSPRRPNPERPASIKKTFLKGASTWEEAAFLFLSDSLARGKCYFLRHPSVASAAPLRVCVCLLCSYLANVTHHLCQLFILLPPAVGFCALSQFRLMSRLLFTQGKLRRPSSPDWVELALHRLRRRESAQTYTHLFPYLIAAHPQLCLPCSAKIPRRAAVSWNINRLSWNHVFLCNWKRSRPKTGSKVEKFTEYNTRKNCSTFTFCTLYGSMMKIFLTPVESNWIKVARKGPNLNFQAFLRSAANRTRKNFEKISILHRSPFGSK